MEDGLYTSSSSKTKEKHRFAVSDGRLCLPVETLHPLAYMSCGFSWIGFENKKGEKEWFFYASDMIEELPSMESDIIAIAKKYGLEI